MGFFLLNGCTIGGIYRRRHIRGSKNCRIKHFIMYIVSLRPHSNTMYH